MSEYVEANQTYRDCSILSPKQTLQKSPGVNPEGLKGALWSADEMIVESREAIEQVTAYLAEKGVEFFFNTAITRVEQSKVYSGRRVWQSEEIFVCSGADFETLYPEIFLETHITKCKLQMMR